MKGITLICSGYGNEKEEDILTVRLDPKGKAQVTGGVRQQDSPSWICAKDGVLYAVSEQVGRAFIGRRSIREDGSLTEEEGRIELPGGELCHLWEGGRALYASCYGTGDFFAVDYDLKKILWHRKPEESLCSQKDADKKQSHAHWVSERDGILYFSDLGRDRIYRFRMEDGLPGEELEPIRLPEGAGPRQLLPLTDLHIRYLLQPVHQRHLPRAGLQDPQPHNQCRALLQMRAQHRHLFRDESVLRGRALRFLGSSYPLRSTDLFLYSSRVRV